MIYTKTNIIAEIGINHNGDIKICKKLIDIAAAAGCDFVKIQKRTPDLCIPENQKYKLRETPWGKISYLDYKKKIEFTEEQIEELKNYSDNKNINLFASVWDIDSSNLMSKYTNIAKIASASITDIELCKYTRNKFSTLIISTGMSTEEEIEQCISIANPDVIMHTNSTYPCPVEDLNLNYIKWLKNKYSTKQIGYSGHEYGLVTTFAAVVLGASWIERHITLDHNMWGSDHLSSLEPSGVFKLVKGIREIEKSVQYDIGPRKLFIEEENKKNILRKI
jgi:N-acetylneuraminate synthase